MSRVVVVGSVNVDLLAMVDRLPQPGETVVGADPVLLPGGKGANQAVGARRQHDAVAFVGAVGADSYGEVAAAALAEAQVDLVGLRTDPQGPTGLALITVAANGENSIVVCAGANAGLDASVAAELPVSTGDVVLLQLEIPVVADLAVAEAARAVGAAVVLNAAPLPSRRDETFDRLLSTVDVLIVNEGEATTLSGCAATELDRDWTDIADALRGHGPSAVVVTLGAAGAVVAGPTEAVAVAAFPVEARDTTGAGDAFCATVGVALARGADLVTAVRRGCAAGALSTTRLGAQSALPTATEIDGLIGMSEVA